MVADICIVSMADPGGANDYRFPQTVNIENFTSKRPQNSLNLVNAALNRQFPDTSNSNDFFRGFIFFP
jgi:hypothetical protein